jgi:adenylate cyclase
MQRFVSPFAVGLYTTLLFVGMTLWFYAKNQTLHRTAEKPNPLFFFIETAHEKSVDLRLVLRGQRAPESNIAILAVDGQSLREGGRWPWPRTQMVKALSAALDAGARLIVFDIVFSEPTANLAEDFANRLRSTLDLPKAIDNEIDKQLPSLNADLQFREFLKKYSNRLILGSLYEEEASVASPDTLTSLCYSLLFEHLSASTPWRNEDALVVHPLQFSTPDLTIPRVLLDAYTEKIAAIETQIIQSRPEARSHRDEVLLQTEIENAQRGFCSRFFKAGEDPFFEIFDADTWNKIKDVEPSLAPYKSFADYAQTLIGSNLRQAVPMGWSWVINIPEFVANSTYNGYFNADQDSDGTIRRTRLISRAGLHYLPSIALKAYLVSQNLTADVIIKKNPRASATTQVAQFRLLDKTTGQEQGTVPVDPDGRLILNYYGSEKMFPHVSLVQLLGENPQIEYDQQVYQPSTHRFELQRTKVDRSKFFKDKILIVGLTATGVFDLRVTPFQENYPGVETHATVLDNLIQHRFLRASSDESVVLPIVCLLLGLALSFVISNVGAIPGLFATVGVLVSIAIIDKYFLFQRGIIVVILFPLLLTLGLYVVLTFYKYLTEERSKKHLRSIFQKYVSPAIVEEVLSNPGSIELGGRKMEVTVFFSDVRDFTSISEKLDPKVLSDLLNEYLTPMTDLVFKNRGTLDKYMGDAIMAFFGAPLSFKDHAKWACRCALEHARRLKELNTHFTKRQLPELRMGIGLNTGEVSVGNMGSQSVRNYTVMGDQVNLASRLEGATKQYGVDILISHSTFLAVKDSFLCREIDCLRVKGKKAGVQVYELLGEGLTDPKQLQIAEVFSHGYQLYRARRFTEALDSFKAALEANTTDHVAEIYIERTLEFIENPPPEDWDGIYTMTTK